jgi:hypothetical protein
VIPSPRLVFACITASVPLEVALPSLGSLWRAFAVTAIVTASAVIALAPSPGWPIHEYDAHLHFSAFAVITLLAVTAFPRVSLGRMLVGLALLGGVIELLQFTPGFNRQPDWADFGFNILGIDAALIVVALARRLFLRAPSQSDAASAN